MIVVTTCPVCGSTHRALLFVAHDTEYNLPGSFPVCRCSDCGMVYLGAIPSPKELTKYYPEEYGAHNASRDWAKRAVWKLLSVFVLHTSAAFYNMPIPKAPVAGARILEIGTGSGLAGEMLAQNGWTVVGCDFSRAATSRSASHGIQSVRCNASHLPFRAGAFDAVFASHVIEHTPDPVAVLSRIREILAPGGKLLLAVPNFDSLDRVLLGPQSFAGLSAPRHMVHFTPATLTDVLVRSGLRITEVRATPQPTFLESLLKRLGVNSASIRASPLLRALIAATAPLDFLFYLMGRGTNILAIGVAPSVTPSPPQGTANPNVSARAFVVQG
jgi:SAM-dependent methyltransferase